MELKEYIKLFKKYLAFIILCMLLGAALGTFFTKFLPSGYYLSQTFFLAMPQGTAQTYDYEGFYAQEKARNFTDSAVAILESPDFKSEVALAHQSLAVKKLAPQTIRLTTVTQNPESSKELMQKTTNTFNKKFIDLAGDKNALSLKQIASSQEPSYQASSRKIYALGGIVIGFAASVAVISLKSYFKL